MLTYVLLAVISMPGTTSEYVLDHNLTLTDCQAQRVFMAEVPSFAIPSVTLECQVEET